MIEFPLCFPKSELKLSISGEKLAVWDIIRKKYIILTPEEWVRQQLLHFLIKNNFPASYMSVETAVSKSKHEGRTDIKIYDRRNELFLLAECKAPYLKLGNAAQTQLSAYHQKLGAKFLLLTNGAEMLFFEKNGDNLQQIRTLPEWK
jgi:hypothetical protein